MNSFLKQTLKNVRNNCRNVSGFDMSYEENMELFRKAFKEDYFTNVQFDIFKKKNEGNYCLCNECKFTFFKCSPKINPF